MESPELEQLRLKIDGIDRDVTRLLNERVRTSAEIGKIKDEKGLEPYDPAREEEVFGKLDDLNEGPLETASLRMIYREVVSASIALQKDLVIGYLGPEATFTHQAAMKNFGSALSYRPLLDITDVFREVERGECDYGVVPVENSTYGTVSDTFDMFYQTSANICGEVSLRIHHHLLSHGGFEDLEEICSHPQALGQCRRWLQRHLPHCQLTETSSTAEAARRAAAKKKTGALASKLAADWYEVPVIQENVEDSSDNFTRFVVLGRDIPEPTGDDKTSLLLVIEDRVGALFDALEAFKKNGINLSLIESRPSRLKSWTYYFFIDIAGHASEACCRKALDEVGTHCETIKCLGSYPRAQDPA